MAKTPGVRTSANRGLVMTPGNLAILPHFLNLAYFCQSLSQRDFPPVGGGLVIDLVFQRVRQVLLRDYAAGVVVGILIGTQNFPVGTSPVSYTHLTLPTN